MKYAILAVVFLLAACGTRGQPSNMQFGQIHGIQFSK